MAGSELLTIERRTNRLVFREDRLEVKSMTDGVPDGVEEAEIDLDLGAVAAIGDVCHDAMILMLAKKTSAEQLPHYKLHITHLQQRLAKMREGLAAIEDHMREDEESNDGATR